MATPDLLKLAYEAAAAQFHAAKVSWETSGDLPSFSLDGVSVNWPDWLRLLKEQMDGALEAWLKADQAYNGPVWLNTVGR